MQKKLVMSGSYPELVLNRIVSLKDDTGGMK